MGVTVSLFQNFMIILVLILTSSFFSISEIALAGSRKIKLKLLAESGDDRAEKVLKLQENSADFFCHFTNWPKCCRHFGRFGW